MSNDKENQDSKPLAEINEIISKLFDSSNQGIEIYKLKLRYESILENLFDEKLSVKRQKELTEAMKKINESLECLSVKKSDDRAMSKTVLNLAYIFNKR